MVNNLGSNFISAYHALKENISPELRKKLEDRSLFHKDILTIARSVFVKEEKDGTYSIEKHTIDRNVVIPKEQQDLIRRICLLEPGAQVQVVRRGRKHKLEEDDSPKSSTKRQKKEDEESVAIARKGVKRKAQQEEDSSQLHKKPKNEEHAKIKEVDDIFSIESGTPVDLLWMMAEYTPETSKAAIDFVKEGRLVPQYIKDNLKHLDLYKEEISLETFTSVISEFKNLKSIRLPENADDSYIEALINIVPKLEKLNVSECSLLTNAGIDAAIKSFSELTHLDLSCSEALDDGLNNLGQLASIIQEVNLSGTFVSGKFLSHLNQNFEGLRNLELRRCRAIEDSSLMHLSGRLPAVENLDVSFTDITDAGIGSVLKGAQKVESLNISGTSIGDDGLRAIAAECPNIRKLDISRCKSVTSAGINSIIENCPNLQELILDDCDVDDRWFEVLAEKPRNLTRLSLENCSEITDLGMERISKGCPNLNYISLRFCPNITDLGIMHLTQGVNALQKLVLVGNNNITSLTLDYILKWRNSLRLLDIADCKKIDNNDALLHLSPGLPYLECLNLYLNNGITDEGVRDFAEWFPNLTSLVLSKTSVTDECLQYLNKLPKLSGLSLLGCLITDAGLGQFYNFPALTRINLIGNSGITSVEEINKLRKMGIEILSSLSTR